MKTEVDKLLRDIKAKKSGLSCIVATHIAYKKYQCVFSKLPLHHRNLAKYSGKLEKREKVLLENRQGTG